MEFTILNKKDNKLWKFVIEKIGHKTKLRIEIGADLTRFNKKSPTSTSRGWIVRKEEIWKLR